jgi:diguanylate cyclase (GGDEF)-like protein/PAS domain S-box-containing protein
MSAPPTDLPSPLNVLLIDPCPADRRRAGELLGALSTGTAHLAEANDLAEAADRLRASPPHVGLVDPELPDSGGLATLHALRRAAPEVPWVVLTGADDPITGLQAIQAGAQDFLPKSRLDADSLQRTLLFAWQRHQAEQALVRRERMISALLESTNDAYIALDPGWCITYFNAKAEVLLGRDRAEVEGQEIWDAFPEMASFFYLPLRRAAAQSKPQWQEGGYPPLGKHLELQIYPWEEGLWLFFRDITQRKVMEEELERLATRDSLTGLYNRHKFESETLTEMARVERYGGTLTLLLFDIDHFKRVNDRFGHDQGDRALTHVTATTRAELRDVDLFGRWGGEEFVILLPETDLESACQAAERMRRAVAESPLPSVGRITLSIGATAFQPGDSLDDLLKRVDDAVYQAKAQGRNRCVSRPSGPPRGPPCTSNRQ